MDYFEEALMRMSMSPEQLAALDRLRLRQQEEKLSSGKWERYTTGTGQTVIVHARTEECDISCVIHNPSDHVMREFPTHWRSDRGLMERICPCGVGHPDVDALAYMLRKNPEATHESTHGCCGCCMSEEERARHFPEV